MILNLGLDAGLCRPRQMRADADPRPLQRARRRGDGRVLDRVPRRQSRQRRERARRSRAVRLRRSRLAGPHRPPKWSRPARAANSTCSTASAAISSARCPSRITSPTRWRNVPLRVHQDIILTDQMFIDRRRARQCSCCPPRRATNRTTAAPRRRTERRVCFSPEIPRQVGEARAEWKILRDLAVAVHPETRASARLRDRLEDARGDRPRRAVLRRHPAPAEDRRRLPIRRPAPLRGRQVSTRPTARRTSAPSRCRDRHARAGRVPRQHAARASNSTR